MAFFRNNFISKSCKTQEEHNQWAVNHAIYKPTRLIILLPGIGDILPPDIPAWVDLGFVGIENDYPDLDVVIPHKKPKHGSLTPEQGQENTVISQLRVKIEHTICRLKHFRAVADIYRNHSSAWADKFILIAAGLSNFHLCLA